MKIGVVGCGAIGAELARAVAEGRFAGLELVAVSDVDSARAQEVCRDFPLVCALSLDELVTRVDIVVQATTAATMPRIARAALEAGCDVLAMSVGGLADDPDLLALAERKGKRLYVPSGALAGLDGVLAAREAGLTSVSLTTTKHPKSLKGAPYLEKNNISLENLPEATVIFDGTAREAISGFPSNVNVAIALSYAGIGVDKTRIRIVADPACTLTQHEVHAEGVSGVIHSVTQCTLSATNPKTSYLAVLASMAVLRSISASLKVGN